jgi:hypothetical protein
MAAPASWPQRLHLMVGCLRLKPVTPVRLPIPSARRPVPTDVAASNRVGYHHGVEIRQLIRQVGHQALLPTTASPNTKTRDTCAI